MGDLEYAHNERARGAAVEDQPETVPGKRTLVDNGIAHNAAEPSGITSREASAIPWGREIAARQAARAAKLDAAKDDQRVIAQAIISGYAVAQRELESSGSIERVRQSLSFLSESAFDYYGGEEFEAVWGAADSFEQALRERMRTAPGRFASLEQLNKQIRGLLGLTGASKPKQSVGAGIATQARDAIVPALDTLALFLRDKLRELDAEVPDIGARVPRLEDVALRIGTTSTYVLGLLDHLSIDERRALAPKADAVAYAAGKLLRWVRVRPAYARLEAVLLGAKTSGGLRALDAVLAAMGAPLIGERDETPLSENQRHAADQEQRDFSDAFERAEKAIEKFAKQEHAEIDTFQREADLDDLPQPDFVRALVDALVDETISSVIGIVAKVLVGPMRQAQAARASGAVRMLGIGTPDLVENVIKVNAASVKKAMKATPEEGDGVKVDRRKLALIYYCRRLKAASDARKHLMHSKLLEARRTGMLTSFELQVLTRRLEDQAEKLAVEQSVLLAKGWAQYLARSRVGGKGRGENRVTDMSGYFGDKTPGGRVFGTDKKGTNGVLVVTAFFYEGRLHRDATKAHVRGLNSVLASKLFAHAEHSAMRVELPKEIHVNAGFGSATIALDERNRVCDVNGWEQVLRHVGGMDAHAFWRVWGPRLEVR